MRSMTQYRCRSCGTSKYVPERPSDAPPTINTGCESCGRIITHERPGAWFP